MIWHNPIVFKSSKSYEKVQNPFKFFLKYVEIQNGVTLNIKKSLLVYYIFYCTVLSRYFFKPTVVYCVILWWLDEVKIWIFFIPLHQMSCSLGIVVIPFCHEFWIIFQYWILKRHLMMTQVKKCVSVRNHAIYLIMPILN